MKGTCRNSASYLTLRLFRALSADTGTPSFAQATTIDMNGVHERRSAGFLKVGLYSLYAAILRAPQRRADEEGLYVTTRPRIPSPRRSVARINQRHQMISSQAVRVRRLVWLAACYQSFLICGPVDAIFNTNGRAENVSGATRVVFRTMLASAPGILHASQRAAVPDISIRKQHYCGC